MPRTNHAGVTEVAHLRTDLDRYGEEYDRIFGKKEDKKEEEPLNEKHDSNNYHDLLLGLE